MEYVILLIAIFWATNLPGRRHQLLWHPRSACSFRFFPGCISLRFDLYQSVMRAHLPEWLSHDM